MNNETTFVTIEPEIGSTRPLMRIPKDRYEAALAIQKERSDLTLLQALKEVAKTMPK